MFFKKKNKKNNKPKSRRLHIYGRYTVISFLILLLSGLCVVFLLNTTVFHANEWNAKGELTLAGKREIPPLRGDILASDGSILATNLNYYNVRIDFRASRINELKYIESADSLADTLAAYYPQRTRDGWYEHIMKPMKVAKKKRSRSYMLLRGIPFDEVERLKNFPYFRRSPNPNRTGLSTERVLLRRYPYGDMAKLSIGRVGQTDTDDHIRGRSGLEAALDSLLYGKPGIAKKRLFTSGTGYVTDTAAINGITVTTTIDITIQDLLEHELGQMLVDCNGEWGSAMIMEVATGDIKAISNLDRDTLNGGYIEAMNHIVQAYEPGSVIKPISMLTALEDGYANVNQVYSIGKSYAYAGGKPINDTHSPAALPVGRFIEYSSNIGMTKLMAPRYENNLNGFRERLREIGFFDRFNTGMSRERVPNYPTLDVKRGGRVSLSRMFYGYATLVPPLYTCAVYNAIANDGRFVRPRLVKAMRMPDGRDSIIPVSYVRDSICSRKNAAILRHMMHEVIWGEGGTAKGLRNDIVEIAGKTGTAKIAMEAPRDAKGRRIISSIPFKGGYREGRHNRVTFCGFFPYENPKYTCIVVVSDPQGPYGAGATGGVVLRNVALKMYSRGMLNNHSDYMAEASDNKQPSKPTLYGTYNNARSANLYRALNVSTADVLQSAASGSGNTSTIPDVRGLGIREALVELEKCGFPVSFSGTGYVTESMPAPGTKVAPGTRVTVTLSQN